MHEVTDELEGNLFRARLSWDFLGLEEAIGFCNFEEWWECYTPATIAEMEEEVT